jgi:Tol biopolymer transport system component
MRMLTPMLLACAALAQAPGSGPELFAPGVISTQDYELNAAFTPDGRTLYYTKSTPQFGGLLTIVVSHLRGGNWSTPEVAEFSGQWSDADPFVSPDGARLFFISTRPVEGRAKKDNDIWVMDRTGSGWSAPRNLGAPVNSADRELYPTVTRDGTLYFVSSRPGGLGGSDIYRARPVNGKYAEPENLGEAVNSRYNEGDAWIAPDESCLVFASTGRPDDLGGGDLYISYRKNGVWTPARHLDGGVNSPAREFCPIGSPDGKYLYFTSERGFGDQPLERRLTYKELQENLRGVRNHLGNIWRVEFDWRDPGPAAGFSARR